MSRIRVSTLFFVMFLMLTTPLLPMTNATNSRSVQLGAVIGWEDTVKTISITDNGVNNLWSGTFTRTLNNYVAISQSSAVVDSPYHTYADSNWNKSLVVYDDGTGPIHNWSIVNTDLSANVNLDFSDLCDLNNGAGTSEEDFVAPNFSSSYCIGDNMYDGQLDISTANETFLEVTIDLDGLSSSSTYQLDWTLYNCDTGESEQWGGIAVNGLNQYEKHYSFTDKVAGDWFFFYEVSEVFQTGGTTYVDNFSTSCTGLPPGGGTSTPTPTVITSQLNSPDAITGLISANTIITNLSAGESYDILDKITLVSNNACDYSNPIRNSGGDLDMPSGHSTTTPVSFLSHDIGGNYSSLTSYSGTSLSNIPVELEAGTVYCYVFQILHNDLVVESAATTFTIGSGYGNGNNCPSDVICWNFQTSGAGSSFSQSGKWVTYGVAGTGENIANTPIPTEGKWYWEYRILRNSGNQGNWALVGVSTGNDMNAPGTQGIGTDGHGWGFDSMGFVYHNNENAAVGCSVLDCWDNETEVIIGIAIDMDSGTMWYSKDGVWPGSTSNDPYNSAIPIFGEEAGWDNQHGSSDLSPVDLENTPLYPAISVTGDHTSHSIQLKTDDHYYNPPEGFEVLGDSELELNLALFWENEDVDSDGLDDELVLKLDMPIPFGEGTDNEGNPNFYFSGLHNIIMNLTVKNDAGLELYSDNSVWNNHNLSSTSGLQKWYTQISEFPPGWNHYCAEVTFEDMDGNEVAFGDQCDYLNVDEPGLEEDCSYVSSSDYLMVTQSTVHSGTMNGRYERGSGWAAEDTGTNDIGTHEGPDALYWYQTQDGDGNTFEEWAFYQRPDNLWSAISGTDPPSDTEGSATVYTSNWGDSPCHPEDAAGSYGTVTHYSGDDGGDGNFVRADIDWNPNENKLTLDIHAHTDEESQVRVDYSIESFDADYSFTWSQDTGTLSVDEGGHVFYSTDTGLEDMDHTYCVILILMNMEGNVLSEGIGCMFIGNYPISSSSVDWNVDISTGSTQVSSGFGDSTVDNNLETFWETENDCSSTSHEHLLINLGNYQDVAGVSLHWGDPNLQPLSYEIAALDSEDNWVSVLDMDLVDGDWYGTIHHVIPVINANKIKIICLESNGDAIRLNELEIHPPQAFNWNPSDGLAGYWNMNEAVGSTQFLDHSSNDNHGQIYGGAELGHPARFGNGLQLHGYTDSGTYVAQATSPLMANNAEFTLSMWVKLDVHDPSAGGLFSFGYQPDAGTNAFFMELKDDELQIVQDGIPRLSFDGFGDPDGYMLNEWNHFVLAVGPADSPDVQYEMQLYVNSNLENSGYLHHGILDNWPLYFGSLSAGDVIDGFIDEVRLYDVELSSEEIGMLYNNAATIAGENNNGGNNGAFDGINFENDLTNGANAFASSERDDLSADASATIDDNYQNTGWQSDGHCPQDIMIDLGGEYDVAAVKIMWGGNNNFNSNFQYDIEVWNSQNGWTMQQSHFLESPPNNENMLHLLRPQPTQKILIKCQNYSGEVRINEIEVFGANADWHLSDYDSDGVSNGDDACFIGLENWFQTPENDYDNDGCNDIQEDNDDDNDGIDDNSDSCPTGEANWDSWANNPVVDYDHDGCHDQLEDDDDDGDAVSDSLDSCPQTRLGAGTNALGCEISFEDADGDGVSDSYDTCPNTPEGTDVDMFNGCPLYSDRDGDGVNDNEDAFPDNPAESADTDIDGIGDNADLCPDSLPGDTVDLTGCVVTDPNNNNDTSDDNETANMTACEEWEFNNPNNLNASLPGNGCPFYTFEDTDGDGVNDLNPDGSELDKCPETEVDANVDEFGCATSVLPPALASALEFILNIDSFLGLPDGTLEILFAVVGMLFAVVRFAGRRTLAGKTRRVEKYANEIRMARSRRELENLEKRITKDNNKGLLPPGGFGDLMELIEMRAMELGEMDMAKQVHATAAEAESMQETHDQMLEEMAGTREAVAGLQDELSEMRSRKGPPGKGRGRKGPPRRRGMDESGYKIKESGGPRRPSLHPADLDGDGVVTDEEKEIWRERQEKEDRLWEYD